MRQLPPTRARAARAQTAPASPTPRPLAATATILAPGTAAPDFTLAGSPDTPVSLRALRGRPVVLAFYPADWSPVCGDQMALYNQVLPEFRAQGAALARHLGRRQWCHAAFADARHLRFPLLADFEPKGAVARQYGVYREDEGTSERALFVLDGDGRDPVELRSPDRTSTPAPTASSTRLDRLTVEQSAVASATHSFTRQEQST